MSAQLPRYGVHERSPVCGVSRSPGTCRKHHPVNALRAYTGLRVSSRKCRVNALRAHIGPRPGAGSLASP